MRLKIREQETREAIKTDSRAMKDADDASENISKPLAADNLFERGDTVSYVI